MGEKADYDYVAAYNICRYVSNQTAKKVLNTGRIDTLASAISGLRRISTGSSLQSKAECAQPDAPSESAGRTLKVSATAESTYSAVNRQNPCSPHLFPQLLRATTYAIPRSGSIRAATAVTVCSLYGLQLGGGVRYGELGGTRCLRNSGVSGTPRTTGYPALIVDAMASKLDGSDSRSAVYHAATSIVSGGTAVMRKSA